MPKVLRIINRLNLGGPTYNVAYLTKYLAPEFDTMLVAGTRMDSEESSEHILEQIGVKAIVLPEMQRKLSVLNDYQTYKRISGIIKEFKPDIVHTHAAKAGAIGRLAAWNAGVPVIVHTFHGHVFHSYFSKAKTRVFIEIERYLARKTCAVVAVSDTQKQELANSFKICKPEKIQVVHLGFDLEKFRQNMEEKRRAFRTQYALEEDTIAIGIVGRIVPVKNHILFIDAVKRLLEQTSKKIKVFIIGDGELKSYIQNYCNTQNISYSEGQTSSNTQIIFTSWIHNIDEAYAGIDIVALSSLNEGTPVSLIEAQAAGKPIVSTKVGGVENVVLAGLSALLSENNPENFSSLLLELVENKSLRTELGAGGANVYERFHYQRLVEDTRQLYRTLLAKKL